YTTHTDIYTLSLHDALPICPVIKRTVQTGKDLPEQGIVIYTVPYGMEHIASLGIHIAASFGIDPVFGNNGRIVLNTFTDSVIVRSEEHTSELQSRENLVCRL